MRKLKFRAWDGETMFEVIEWIHNGRVGVTICDSGPFMLQPHEHKLMQYTGLKDKNGKEIYEGDIVKSWNLTDDNGDPRVCTVEWDRNYYGIFYWTGERRSSTGLRYSDDEFGVEIIGNIYENLELLNLSEGKEFG